MPTAGDRYQPLLSALALLNPYNAHKGYKWGTCAAIRTTSRRHVEHERGAILRHVVGPVAELFGGALCICGRRVPISPSHPLTSLFISLCRRQCDTSSRLICGRLIDFGQFIISLGKSQRQSTPGRIKDNVVIWLIAQCLRTTLSSPPLFPAALRCTYLRPLPF